MERIKRASSETGGDAGELTPFGPGSYEIALLAAGGCITAVDAVLDGKVDNAYALVRPPGHHAERDQGRGFCIFANTALAAAHSRQQRGLSRVAIVDWDVHHGNGTEHAFYDDPSVLTISIHQDNNYPPGSGAIQDTGAGEGKGYNINIPLPAGSGVGAYVATFERVVAPALRAFRPELILIASGLDASAMDPLASMMMTSDGYRKLTQVVLAVARDVCGGRLVACHEGGYSPAYVPYCGLAIIEEMAGVRTGLEDPLLDLLAAFGGQELQPHQDVIIQKAAKLATALSVPTSQT
jgi:acetoin utilization deacetylase AcuC-like enzyme